MLSTPLILLVTAIYVAVGINETYIGRHGIGVMFFGYAIANLGIIWSLR